MDQSNEITVKSANRVAYSYKSLYKLNHVIYKIGDYSLPFPVNLDFAVLYFSYLILVTVLSFFFPVILKAIPLDETITRFALPALLAKLTSNLDPAGKSVLKYVIDIVKYFFRNKMTHRNARLYRPLRRFIPKFKTGLRNVIFDGNYVVYPKLPLVGVTKDLEGLMLEMEHPVEVELRQSGRVALRPGKYTLAVDQEESLKRKNTIQCGPGELRVLRKADGLAIQFKLKKGGGKQWPNQR